MTNFELTRMLADTSRANLLVGPYKVPVHIDNVDYNVCHSDNHPNIDIRCSVMYAPWREPIAVKAPKKITDPMAIKDVIFNNPATIVIWADGTKTVVKCTNEEFDPEKGLAMAIAKKALGNKGNYYETFKNWGAGNDQT